MADEIELLRRFIDETPGPSTGAWVRARAAVAAARSEEEPAGHRHMRPVRRRRCLLAITAGVAVAAAVGGLLAVLLPTSLVSTGGQQIQTTAYVTRVEHALTSPRQGDLAGYARTVYPPGTVLRPTGGLSAGPGTGSPWSVGSTVTWAYQHILKTSAFTTAGRPVFSERTTLAAGRSETVAVIYRNATWWRVTAASPAGRTPACAPGMTPGLTIISRWAVFISDESRCGGYRTDGRQRVDGIDAVKLTGGKALVSLWVNPATYRTTAMNDGAIGPGRPDAQCAAARPARRDVAQEGPRQVRGIACPAGDREVPGHLPGPAVGRGTAAGSDRPRPGQRPGSAARGRADRGGGHRHRRRDRQAAA